MTSPSHTIMPTTIRPINPDEYHECEHILRGLPDWFGIEEALVNYVNDIKVMQTWVARRGDTVAGFLTLNRHNAHSAEIHVMAVAQAYHGQGYGRQLIEFAQQVLQREHFDFLQVKTLATTSPDPHYARTRGFYEHLGFKPLEENLLWGKANPCLIMVKHL